MLMLSEPPPLEVTSIRKGLEKRPRIDPVCLRLRLLYDSTALPKLFPFESKAVAVNVTAPPAELVASTINLFHHEMYLVLVIDTVSDGLTGLTVSETVAAALTSSPSFTLNVKLSAPLKSGSGV